MKKFLVSIIAISVATSAMAASTLVSSGDSKSTQSVAAHRAGSLRVNNKVASDNSVVKSAARNNEIGRIGSIKTIGAIKTSSGSGTNSGTTGGTNAGTSGTNSGALTNAAIQSQMDALSVRIDTAYDAAALAADSVIEAKRTINDIKVNLDTIESNIATLQATSDADVSTLTESITTLQGNLGTLEQRLTTLAANSVQMSEFNQQVGTLNQEIENVKGKTEQLSGLTSSDISDLQNRVTGALSTIENMQNTLATKIDSGAIANMATLQNVADAKDAAVRYTDAAKADANTYTDSKIGNIGSYASAKEYADAAKTGANAYTDTKTTDMATKTFVNNRIGLDDATGRTIGRDSAPTVKEYVDAKDNSTRGWVSDTVVGPIQDATVKAYIDGKFNDAADPNNENGWAHHIGELNSALQATQAEMEEMGSSNSNTNSGLAGRISDLEAQNSIFMDRFDDLDTAQQQNASEIANQAARLDARVENLKTYFNTLDAGTVKKDKFNEELTAASAYGTLKANVDAIPATYVTKTSMDNALANKVSNDVFGNYTNAVAANYVRNDALNNKLKETDAYVTLTANVDAIPASIAATYMTKEDAATDKNNLKNLITANTNQIAQKMNSADFAEKLAADTAFKNVQTNLAAAATKAELQNYAMTTNATLQEKYLQKDNLSSNLVAIINDDTSAISDLIATKVAGKLTVGTDGNITATQVAIDNSVLAK